MLLKILRPIRVDGVPLHMMSAGMERYFPEGLARGEVVSSHWALWQAAAGVNKIVGEWIAQLA
ncbi:hypothetical protein BN1708_009695 [Verticillium longisporum]|uniref:Uncharacterized protein n=1 Tax=Verticillium longisporum TaxID=100787 RepID=A0A0G4KJM7_VERLO|nr:hypothetical protein BN1708_009695 [Verticillium longisporum]